MKHEDVWRAIDILAAERGLSPSGLARLAGLDATSLNVSKRYTVDGHLRWPSTRVLAQLLEVSDVDLNGFSQLVYGDRVIETARAVNLSLPVFVFADTGIGKLNGCASDLAERSGEFDAFIVKDPSAYAIRILGDFMKPSFCNGDLLIVSPAVEVGQSDRVVFRTLDGQSSIARLVDFAPHNIELESLDCHCTRHSIDPINISWLHCIKWVSF